MTTRYKTLAFVFKKNNVNEADRNFSVFTESFGRLDIFAKAIRKNASKLRSGMDVFFVSEIEFVQGKIKKTLTDAVVVKKFSNIPQDIRKFKIANEIGETLDNFIKGEEKDERIFDLLTESFSNLNDKNLKSDRYLLVYYYFLWNILSLLGYCPEVRECNICHQKLDPRSIYFSYKVGGTICKKCSVKDTQAKVINSDIVKILRLIFQKDWGIISKLKIDQSSQKLFGEISRNYQSYILSSHSFKDNFGTTVRK